MDYGRQISGARDIKRSEHPFLDARGRDSTGEQPITAANLDSSIKRYVRSYRAIGRMLKERERDRDHYYHGWPQRRPRENISSRDERVIERRDNTVDSNATASLIIIMIMSLLRTSERLVVEFNRRIVKYLSAGWA